MIRWQLIVMGEPCQSGTAPSNQEAIAAAREALKKRSDYSSILSLGIEVSVRLTKEEGCSSTESAH